YPNDDFKYQPDRKRLPTPGDMEEHYPHTIDPVEEPANVQDPEVVIKHKRLCLVM
ncbi:cadherin EGF LAG seven-pass G-type receptor 1, partial [Biomphalaria glabrata]